ncbi:LysR family transcriptional regulator [Clostridium sp. D2Q-11]|uniref:LysR family transcriptional regulator n=1 Tax=Anaeromonas frigoriresistens TaxID=2683708 RepID=A0A942URV5_9FIRM|nr:LysR family transcriptional regulator [Anaeromonas frigoriresistens]MBS4538038.1 LysR family transcriptional regulator [Anaeromonas frigoriresistens]
MNIDYLKAFYVTVKANSISKAARIMHLTQPGLSMQIQSLEKELQVSLLNRSNRGVELTEAGQIVFDYANTILSLQDNIERDLTNLKTHKKKLLIGSCKSIGEYALPCSVYIYKHENPDIDINLEISNTATVIDNVLNKTVNVGIVQGKIDHKDLVYEKITSNKMLLVTSLPLVKDNITIEELKKLPLIFREEGSGAREDITKALSEKNILTDDLNIIYELNSMEAIKTSVISAKGISFIPELIIKRELRDKVLTNIDVEDLDIVSDYYIVYKKNNNLNPYEQGFVDFLKSKKRGFC